MAKACGLLHQSIPALVAGDMQKLACMRGLCPAQRSKQALGDVVVIKTSCGFTFFANRNRYFTPF